MISHNRSAHVSISESQIPIRFAQGIISNPDISVLDSSTNIFHRTALMKYESHYH